MNLIRRLDARETLGLHKSVEVVCTEEVFSIRYLDKGVTIGERMDLSETNIQGLGLPKVGNSNT